MIPRGQYIVEGEILNVQPRLDNEERYVYYTCQVTFEDGSVAILSNVKESSMFGGIGDYQRRRARARSDSEFPQNSFDQADLDASVGERVYIAFIGGSIYNPIIIGYRQHPNQVQEFENPDQEQPAFVKQILGFREDIDDKGQWRLTRKGAPEVSFSPISGNPISLSSDGYKGDNSPALKPQEDDQRLIIEVLDGALFRVRDPEGGIIEIDHKGKKGIFLSNNDWKSSEDVDGSSNPSSGGLKGPSSTDAEYIHLDRDSKTAYVAGRNLVHIESQKELRLVASGKATIALNNGKIAIGTQSAELFDLLVQLLDQLDQILQQIQALTVPTAVGPSGPPVNTPAFTAAQAQVSVIKSLIENIKGSI